MDQRLLAGSETDEVVELKGFVLTLYKHFYEGENIMKRTISIFLVILMLLSAAPLAGVANTGWGELFAPKAKAFLNASGKCGENVNYTFDSSTGTLTISGSGAMSDYSFLGSPFSYETSIKSVVIESGVTSIGNFAFYACGLTTITLPNSVTSIGEQAFAGCKSLTSITIPDSVTSIGIGAFYYCTSLTSVTIPKSVTSVGDGAFSSCSSLTVINVDSTNPNYSSDTDGVLYNKDKTELICCPAGNSRTAFSIPESVTSICDYAFYGYTSLTSITIPDSVTSIGKSAFYGCTSLTSIKIPDSVTSIGDYAFSNCKSLSSITIPDSVTSIEEDTFEDCTSLKSITIPESVTSIGSSAFVGCTSLTSITIPNSVTSIGIFAFSGCTSLTSINVTSGNSNYSSDTDGVLYNKDKTELICWPAGNKITAFSIPDSVSSIGSYAFYSCKRLTSITIPDSVTSIGDSAFAYCENLTNITIPDSVTSIERGTFEGCTSLTSVTIPDSVTYIGREAFCYCSSLKSVTIPKSVTSIGIFAFDDCSPLNDMYYFGTQQEWSAIDIDSNNEFLKKATIHYMNDGEVTTAASCVSDGIITYTCTVCPATLTETIPALGHDWSDWTESAAATCSTAGAESRSCSRCFVTETRETTGGGNHSPADAVRENEVPATCLNTGSYDSVVYCSTCGVELSRTEMTTEKTAHSYANKVTKATPTADGKIIPTCSVCGAKKAVTVIPKASNVSVQYTAYAYSGKVKSPKIIVKDSKGNDIASSNYTLSWSNASPKAIGNYTVTVKFKGNYSGSKTLSFKIIPAKVTNLKAAVESKKIRVTATTIKLTWSKVAGAKYYAVQYSKDGKNWSFATKATTATSFIVKNLKAGTKYQFRVKALDSTKKFSGAYSAVLTKRTLCAAPAITLKSTKSKTATVSWKKVTGAKKYIIETSTNGKTWKKIKTTTALSYTITGLTGGKKIYVKVQAQNADKLNGAFSSVKSVTVKK